MCLLRSAAAGAQTLPIVRAQPPAARTSATPAFTPCFSPLCHRGLRGGDNSPGTFSHSAGGPRRQLPCSSDSSLSLELAEKFDGDDLEPLYHSHSPCHACHGGNPSPLFGAAAAMGQSHVVVAEVMSYGSSSKEKETPRAKEQQPGNELLVQPAARLFVKLPGLALPLLRRAEPNYRTAELLPICDQPRRRSRHENVTSKE